MTTDTPRTDEICLSMAETDYETREGQQVLLLAYFSRQLELELNEVKAEVERLAALLREALEDRDNWMTKAIVRSTN